MPQNIMIIDDSPVDRKIIRQVLTKRLQGVTIFEAESGLELSEKLLYNNIHMCILDILMPQKDGFQILKEIKEEPDLMDIPVIVCTGTQDEQAIEKALSLGAYDYFSKPFSEEVIKISLPLKVKNAIELMQRREEIIYLSYHDKLTGLYNRRFCEEELQRLDTERNFPVSLILGDVNGLKLTNDAFGHLAGDRLLLKIACILKKECRSDDVVGRIGGDEFMIVLPKTKADDAEKIIHRIQEQCEKEKEEPINPSISLGFAVKESIDQDIRQVYKTAEDRMYSMKLVESRSIRNLIISNLIKTLQKNSNETRDHNNRIMKLVYKIGNNLQLSVEQIDNLRLLAVMHDIGITTISENILKKPEEFTSEENSILKNHCEIGYRIANALSDIAHISNDILSHHERWDGKGYPQGLKGDEIPLNARIIAVLDTYDLMVNGNFYEYPVSSQEALEFIQSQSGKWFDPKIVEAFVKSMNEKSEQKVCTF